MAGKHLGRKAIIKRDSEPIASVRTKETSVNRESVDVTDDDSSGWRELLGEAGQVEVSISVSGVLANDDLRDEALSVSGGLKATTLEYPDGGTLEGDFFLSEYSESHEYNEAAEFEAEMQSSGQVTYTPAA